ncbi:MULTISPECIES: arsenate reductase (glutaredoxin) [Bizionia]|uniref:Arsenate reductase (Glutaredoxin) n=1 Tax=Bizionia algoritergicola TaxID=291187 RepID=A0A5D0QXI1_9FLAO|nr:MULTISPECIES: arsenate reductase (glutaredoxin) [Bizionia]OBX23987.1 arsenate reductase (glutaredoxin) [Bizionia sp. APA-3]TYB73495.1 arsenate reductase (glutaredoxin) [Bizionia algoritergicola]
MITIYHNNRCSKSRSGLEILENSGKPFEVKKYLDDVPSEAELKNVITLLGIKPIELVRKNEAIWKEQYKGTDLSDADLISAMVKNPKLIERPIVVNGKQAVIGRPPEKILEII